MIRHDRLAAGHGVYAAWGGVLSANSLRRRLGKFLGRLGSFDPYCPAWSGAFT